VRLGDARRPGSSRPLLGVAAAVLVALLPLFVIGILHSQSRARGDIAQRFRERAKIGAGLSESLFSSAFRTGQAATAKLYGGAHVSSRMLDVTVRGAGLAYSILLGPDGRLLAASSHAPPEALRQVRVPRGPAHRVLTGAPFFIADQQRLSAGMTVLPSAQAIATRFGRRVLVTASPARRLYQFLGGYISELPTTAGGGAYVVDSNDTVLGSTSNRVATGRPIPDRSLLAAMDRRGYGSFGRGRYFASYPVGGSSWIVVLTASSAALFASVNGVTYWLPWVVLAGFALAVALMLVLLQRVALANRRLARTNDELGRNVSELHESQERLAHDALHDALTELPNRTLFNDRLAQALARCERHPGYSCAVLFIDLDRFKVINDGFSHAAGDELLVALARRIAASLRPGDTVARFGGDEFTLLLDDVGSAEEASALARRLCSQLERPVWLSGNELFVTASIGIALSRRGASSDELLRSADIAMYHAKAQGHGRVAVFDRSMHIRIVRKVRLESELREAIERGRLEVFYQPIVDLGSGHLSGLEALARWPRRGPDVTPDEFIAVAEETGLIGALGQFVLNDACMRLGDWRSRGLVADHVTVSVNVSARQLTPDLDDIVTAALTRHNLPPTALRLEITETTIMQAPEHVDTVLAKLERTGVRAQIDDFGTGYSSLSSLHGFRGDALKVDRAFVGSLQENGGSEAIVGGIIALAHNVNLQVIAEGVDHPGQVGKLRKLGCEYGQGFLLCRPLPPAAAEERLRTWDAATIAAIGAPTSVDPAAPAGEAGAITSA